MNTNQSKTLYAVETASEINEPLIHLDVGDFGLLIASKEIVGVISSQQLMPSANLGCGGFIKVEQYNVPVFLFNKVLQLQAQLPEKPATLAVMQYQLRLFALCCFGLSKHEFDSLHFFSIPKSMSCSMQPFTTFAMLNDQTAGLTTSADMWRLISLRGAASLAPLRIPSMSIQGAG